MSQTFYIKDETGKIINTIVATFEFVDANYEHYEEVLDPQKIKDEEREWRNQELKDTDWLVPVTDHPQRAAYLVYRQALRDWPSTSEFPDTRPTLGV